ncbi:MAG: pilus assembly protein, partial [Oscillospiraceae bacterium]|nr:pilus assembly protein [Oscillospiraceae bacterium]
MSKMLKKFTGKIKEEDSGVIMLEFCIIIIFVLFVLIAILSLGFAYYQQSVLTTVANETAEYAAAGYKYPASDIENIPINNDTISNIEMYRSTFKFDNVEEYNRVRAENYAEERFSKSTLGINNDLTIKEKEDFNLKFDGIGRYHVELTLTLDSKILFQGALEYFGFDDNSFAYRAS